ncbi:MAG: hypothetical protein H0W19_05805 [Nitrosopumilus sp.]|nr:hypothetical protein [Nitrosopumilus sp.]
MENKQFSALIVLSMLSISTFIVLSLPSNINFVAATIDNPKDQLLPFDMKDIFGGGPGQNETSNNYSSTTVEDNSNKMTKCEMPPCPPGQACIQSCP